MAVFQPIQGVPTFLADGTQQGVAPTGYAPGTVVRLLGEQLSAPQPLPPQTTFQPQQAANVFQPLMDGGGFDFGADGSTGTPGETPGATSGPENSSSNGFGLTDAFVDLGLGPFNPSPMSVSLSALSAAVPALAPLGLAFSAANALGAFSSPMSNALGQTQQFGYGNETQDMFGNVVGSPENVASIAGFNPATQSFEGPTGASMGPAPSPDVFSPDDFSQSADQSQSADSSGSFGDAFGESTANEIGFDDVDSSSGDGTGGNGKVICTELHRQGKLDDATMDADKKFGENVAQNDPHTMIGYHYCALPIVRQMRKSKIITFIVSLLALPWAREMYFRQTGNGRGSYRGRVLMRFGIPVCRFIGRRRSRGWVPPFRD